MTELSIIYEDSELLIVNKPPGLVVNRSQTIKEDTLQDKVEKYLKLHVTSDLPCRQAGKLQVTDEFIRRSGVVHRIDRETSGLLIVAKTKRAFEDLQVQFKAREVKKEYLGLVHGWVKANTGVISSVIGRLGKFGKFGVLNRAGSRGGKMTGRESVTSYQVLKRLEIKEKIFEDLVKEFGKKLKNFFEEEGREYSYLRILPFTGRTHQIRVHLKSISHPVVADSLYSGRRFQKLDPKFCPRMFLHASKIEFLHPKDQKAVHFTSPFPSDLQTVFDKLE